MTHSSLTTHPTRNADHTLLIERIENRFEKTPLSPRRLITEVLVETFDILERKAEESTVCLSEDAIDRIIDFLDVQLKYNHRQHQAQFEQFEGQPVRQYLAIEPSFMPRIMARPDQFFKEIPEIKEQQKQAQHSTCDQSVLVAH